VKKRVALPLLLIFLTASCVMAKPAAAEDDINGNLYVISPNSYTAYTDTMLLDLQIAWTVSAPIPWMHVTVSYSIDAGPKIAITNESSVIFERSSSVVLTYANSVVDISNLADGKHKFTIFADGDYNWNNDFVRPLDYSFAPVYFHVNIVTPPDILVMSPQFKTYNATNVPLNFTVDVPTSWIGYSLDNQNNETLRGNTTLTGLSDGSHRVAVYAIDAGENMGASRTVTFTVAVPPKIVILWPLNQTYTKSEVPLVFTLDKPANRTHYSLDGQLNVTVTGNGTITGVPDGMHKITLYADDSFGNVMHSETIYFSVKVPEEPEPQPKPFPVVPVAAASIATIAVVGVGLLVYYKKRSHNP